MSSNFKSSLPVIYNYYGIRNPKIHLPPINHAFAEQMIQYGFINLLNKDKDASDIINCIQQHTFCKFKSGLKYGIIDKYLINVKFWIILRVNL